MLHITHLTSTFSRHQNSIFTILIFYLSFGIVYLNLPPILRGMLLLLFVVYQIKSFQNATLVLLIVIFIPFYADIFKNVGVPFLTPARVLFIPYLYYALKTPKIRNLPVNGHLLFIILLSIASLKITSDILYTIQNVPGESEKGFKNMIAGYYSIYIKLAFIYFTFTRLKIEQINSLWHALLLLVFLEATCLLFLVAQRPEI